MHLFPSRLVYLDPPVAVSLLYQGAPVIAVVTLRHLGLTPAHDALNLEFPIAGYAHKPALPAASKFPPDPIPLKIHGWDMPLVTNDLANAGTYPFFKLYLLVPVEAIP
ncbi:hypothetical protein hamaS1_25040 [Moorella sp. Hama-1]|nr:hypothetical protein hamaS1_25040 [Moorella sp. Hama-1]